LINGRHIINALIIDLKKMDATSRNLPADQAWYLLFSAPRIYS